MRTTLWLGISTNGMIADKNGNEEFLSDNIWKLFVEQVQSTKSVIMGRKAYEGLLKWPKEYMAELAGISKIVLTTKNNLVLLDDWQLAHTPQEGLGMLKAASVDHVTVAGGATTSASFLQAKLINEIIYAIEPVIKGEGIPAFAPMGIEQKLSFLSMQNINGIALLRYNLA